ncbi:MAG TPA: hypothetical protein VGA20_03990 [Gemmatimonadales bacterium]
MIDKDQESKWDKEMSEVDKMLAKLPTYEPAKQARGGDATLRRPGFAGPPGGTAGGMWLKVGLSIAVAIGVTMWPYTHACGPKLFLYVIATGTVTIAGAWAALASWTRRHGFAHVMAMAVLVWGLALTARTVLPRLETNTGAEWFCPGTVAPPSR